jgi:hypothetical protein
VALHSEFARVGTSFKIMAVLSCGGCGRIGNFGKHEKVLS